MTRRVVKAKRMKAGTIKGWVIVEGGKPAWFGLYKPFTEPGERLVRAIATVREIPRRGRKGKP